MIAGRLPGGVGVALQAVDAVVRTLDGPTGPLQVSDDGHPSLDTDPVSHLLAIALERGVEPVVLNLDHHAHRPAVAQREVAGRHDAVADGARPPIVGSSPGHPEPDDSRHKHSAYQEDLRDPHLQHIQMSRHPASGSRASDAQRAACRAAARRTRLALRRIGP